MFQAINNNRGIHLEVVRTDRPVFVSEQNPLGGFITFLHISKIRAQLHSSYLSANVTGHRQLTQETAVL